MSGAEVPELWAQDLAFGYGPRRKMNGALALRRVSVVIRPGEVVGIVGPNGAGKSTLLKLLSGVARPSEGSVHLGGRDLREWRPRQVAQVMAVLPQTFTTLFSYSVEEMVLMGRAPFRSGLGWEMKEDYAKVHDVLEETDLLQFRKRAFTELSAGEQGRVLLARALAQEPRIMLLDEPTESLDLRYRTALLDRVLERHRRIGMSVVMVSHDVNLVAEYCPRVLLVHGGEVRGDGPVEEVLTEEALRDVFGVTVAAGRNPVTGSPHFYFAPRPRA